LGHGNHCLFQPHGWLPFVLGKFVFTLLGALLLDLGGGSTSGLYIMEGMGNTRYIHIWAKNCRSFSVYHIFLAYTIAWHDGALGGAGRGKVLLLLV
jgi:hypothetical protein